MDRLYKAWHRNPVAVPFRLIRPIAVLCFLHGVSAGIDILPPSPPVSAGAISAIDAGRKLRAANRFPEAIAQFRVAEELASKAGDVRQEARALNFITGCQIRLYQYRTALQTSALARQLALQSNFDDLAGAISNNRATIYLQLGDFPLAIQEVNASIELFRHSSKPEYLSGALSNLGDAQALNGHVQESVKAFQEAVNLAHSAGLQKIEATAEDHLGMSLIDANDLAGAEHALQASKALMSQDSDAHALSLVDKDLAWLAYKQGHYRNALLTLNHSSEARVQSASEMVPYWEPKLRGDILLAMQRRPEALTQYRRAVQAANSWRLEALPGDASSTRTVVALHNVHQSYVELAADLAVERHDPVLARRAYDVLVQNRAASLREQILSVLGRQMRLPPRYFELLKTLQNAQAMVTLGKNPQDKEANERKLDLIRLQITALENEIGLQKPVVAADKNGKLAEHGSLQAIQATLSPDDLLLSFCLGEGQSFLWAVTQNELKLLRLPNMEKLGADAVSFSNAVKRNAASEAEGLQLATELFGQLPAHMADHPNWLIAADGALLNSVPFSSLPDTGSEESMSLAAHHTLRFVPSEMLLTDPKPSTPTDGFVGVADPIYNLADSRRVRHFSLFPANQAQTSITLARLVGSNREVNTAAQASGLGKTQILTGSDASGANIRHTLEGNPAVVHFAVHVVSPETAAGHPSASPEAALALTLSDGSMPELLTREDIATLRLNGSLVVLSGCSSQQGENLPTAGLMGLSRAWLLAGASAVVVSAWPTPDDSGRFFSTFYGHLRSDNSQSGNLALHAAVALQQTQVDMQRNGGYRSSPSFWASYSLISKE